MTDATDRDGIPNRFDRDSRFYDARATWRHAQWGDFDRDGVLNQFDRAPRNPRRHGSVFERKGPLPGKAAGLSLFLRR